MDDLPAAPHIIDMSNLNAALTYIASASDNELDALIDAMNRRRRANQANRAAAVVVGMDTVIGDISPKYLSGLRGQVTSINGARASVTLDERSTAMLRRATSRFRIAPDTTNYLLGGVPLSCLTNAA